MIELNLVAERMRQRQFAETLQRVAFFACLLFFVAAVIAFTYVVRQSVELKTQIELTRGELAKAQEVKSRLDELQAEISAQEPLVRLLVQAHESEVHWCRALDDVLTALPAEATIDSLVSSDTLYPRVSIEGQRAMRRPRHGLTISGVAASNELIGEFMAALARTSSIDETHLNYARRQDDEGTVVYQYEIIALLKEGA